MKALTKKEARHIIAKHLLSYATLYLDKREDVYVSINEMYVSDKSRVVIENYSGGGIEKLYYPTDEDIETMIQESKKIISILTKQLIN